MNTRDYLTKIHTHLQDRNIYKPLTYNQTSAIANATSTLIEFMHSQHMIDKATKGFLVSLKVNAHLSSMGYPKFTSQAALSALLLLGGMVKLTFSLPTSPISSSPQLATSHHTSKTQNIFSTSSKNWHPFQPMPSWSQLMSRPYKQKFHTKKTQQL